MVDSSHLIYQRLAKKPSKSINESEISKENKFESVQLMNQSGNQENKLSLSGNLFSGDVENIEELFREMMPSLQPKPKGPAIK